MDTRPRKHARREHYWKPPTLLHPGLSGRTARALARAGMVREAGEGFVEIDREAVRAAVAGGRMEYVRGIGTKAYREISRWLVRWLLEDAGE